MWRTELENCHFSSIHLAKLFALWSDQNVFSRCKCIQKTWLIFVNCLLNKNLSQPKYIFHQSILHGFLKRIKTYFLRSIFQCFYLITNQKLCHTVWSTTLLCPLFSTLLSLGRLACHTVVSPSHIHFLSQCVIRPVSCQGWRNALATFNTWFSADIQEPYESSLCFLRLLLWYLFYYVS